MSTSNTLADHFVLQHYPLIIFGLEKYIYLQQNHCHYDSRLKSKNSGGWMLLKAKPPWGYRKASVRKALELVLKRLLSSPVHPSMSVSLFSIRPNRGGSVSISSQFQLLVDFTSTIISMAKRIFKFSHSRNTLRNWPLKSFVTCKINSHQIKLSCKLPSVLYR